MIDKIKLKLLAIKIGYATEYYNVPGSNKKSATDSADNVWPDIETGLINWSAISSTSLRINEVGGPPPVPLHTTTEISAALLLVEALVSCHV